MNPKISIIVPVYNVEKYLYRCINSILDQTFKDFEVILVNDGSTDSSGDICECFAKKDSRVLVINKENGGLSTARNAGLDIARGEYIGFVDSDDYIEKDMYELLYKLCIENEADISNCTSTIYYPNRTVVNGRYDLVIHNREKAMETMLNGVLYDEVVWVKLFKKSVIGDIRFPVGRIYEDTAFTYKIINNSNRICSIGKPKYNYIKRDGSIMSNGVKNINMDSIIAYEEMYFFLKDKYPQLVDLIMLKLANNSLVILNLICQRDNYEEFKESYYKVARLINKYFKSIMSLSEVHKNVKILLIANRIHPILYKKIVCLLSKRRAL